MVGDLLWRLIAGKNHREARARWRARRARTAGHTSGTVPAVNDRRAGAVTGWPAPPDGSQPRPTTWTPTAPDLPGAPGALTGGAPLWRPPHPVPPPHGPVPPAGAAPPRRPSSRESAFDVVDGVREPWWTRARRLVVLGAITVFTVLGAVDVTVTMVGALRPSTSTPASEIADEVLDGVAEGVAVDYLSWDARERERREQALRRWALPDREVDGWDGQGRQSADSAAVLARARRGVDQAVVTVRVRVVPYAPDEQAGAQNPSSTQPPAEEPDASPPVTESGVPAAQPAPTDPPGWQAHPARWLVLAVPLARHDGRVLLTAPPALVGDPGTTAGEPVPVVETVNDDRFTRETRQAVQNFFEALATGELDFVRAPRARVSSLESAVALVEVRQWRGMQAQPGAPPQQRAGVASVVWRVAENAGQLTCTYRLDLHRQDDRWLLAGIDIDTGKAP